MKLEFINSQLSDVFKSITFENECHSNFEYVYSFSDADGVRTGKSGWSFGITQLDINNNPYATLCLREAEFTTDEIDLLKKQSSVSMMLMDAKLKRHKDAVDKYDRIQLDECLQHSLDMCIETRCDFSRLETFLHIADYHNQFYFSKGGKLYKFLQAMSSPISPEDILKFKLSLPWGIKRPDDVQRRYKNISKIVKL